MKRSLLLTALTILTSMVLYGQDVSDQLRWGRPTPPRRGGACFYKHPEFRGESFCLASGQTVSSLPRGFNDKISSIRVFGRTRVTIFNDRDFRGKLVPFERDIRDLRNLPINDNAYKSWNDRISSIMVTAGRR